MHQEALTVSHFVGIQINGKTEENLGLRENVEKAGDLFAKASVRRKLPKFALLSLPVRRLTV